MNSGSLRAAQAFLLGAGKCVVRPSLRRHCACVGMALCYGYDMTFTQEKPMRAHAYKASGFSLVELSIVLVILGLLVGGVLTGQSLIRAAELRSVTTEYGKYSTAIRAFKDKYFALPGDMTNAIAFWGPAPDCADTATTAGTGTQTCNGDGNNNIYAGKEGSFGNIWPMPGLLREVILEFRARTAAIGMR